MKNSVSWYKKLRFAWYCFNNTQRAPSDTYQKYPPTSNFGGRKVLNLGCGHSIYNAPNVINLDVYENEGVNIAWDLSKTPLPFEDETFDFIIANHILEHVPNWWECFKELARIVKVGGRIEVWLPGDGSNSQLGYRDHINIINECSWVGIRGTRRNKANLWETEDRKKLGFVKDLKIDHCITRVIDYWWIQLLPVRLQNWCIMHLRNVALEHGWFFDKLPPEGEK